MTVLAVTALTVINQTRTSMWTRSFCQSLSYRQIRLPHPESFADGMRRGLYRSRLRPRFSALAEILIFVLSFCVVMVAQDNHHIIFKAGEATAYAHGQFSKKVHEVKFWFDGHVGQRLTVKITPLTPQLTTAGVVLYPSGKQDGGPGGVVFDSVLTETGRYGIRVTQRQAQVNGSFRVLVKLSPPASQSP
jgi:hypothetical protein